MMEKVYNKLVRDNIPEIIKSNGGNPIIRRLNDMEYERALQDKLFEEYKEVLEAIGNDRIEELADMLEIMLSLANLQNKNLSDIIDVMEKKRIKRGAFTKKLFLEKVIE